MQPQRLLRLPEVKHITGFSRTRIYDLVAQGSFPVPIKLGARAIAWHQSEIQDWVTGRPRKAPTSTSSSAAGAVAHGA
jgi:prophage regulatory protein